MPSPETQLVAADVEFQNTSRGFDLDDVDIIDGTSGKTYGSNPFIAFLRGDGSFQSWTGSHTNGPLRLLLVWQIPASASSVKLGYWGTELTPSPIAIAPEGLVLPRAGAGD